jgi:hypothetical protein
MHTLEHIGLGRYGDPLNPLGDRVAMRELQRVLADGGSLLIVVPVGRPRIQFNAHRIYDPQMIEAEFDQLKLHSWSLLTDDYEQGLLDNPSRELAIKQSYGCGCFWFKRG